MKILWVATKAPWPPVDGGRVLTWRTLELLREAGAAVTCLAPCVPHQLREASAALASVCRPELIAAPVRPPLSARLSGLLRGLPASPASHRRPELARRLDRLVDAGEHSLVHAEQVQAFPQVRGALCREVPLVVRAQNVESALWHGAAEAVSSALAPLLRWEARRLERWEGRVLQSSTAVVALTAEDQRSLSGLAPGARVEVIPAPHPQELPPGDPLPGAPAVLLLGSAGWLPNQAGADWFLARVWPRLKQRLPEAILHLFSPSSVDRLEGAQSHPPPTDSRTAFAAGGVLVVPLALASGVRIKILEAWARGIPVVATPAAAAGLGAGHERALLVAADEEAMVEAVAKLHGDPGLRDELVTEGRRRLARHHDPVAIAGRYLELYQELVAGAESRGSNSGVVSWRTARRGAGRRGQAAS